MNESQRSRAEGSDHQWMISNSSAKQDLKPRGGAAPSVTGREAAAEEVMEPSKVLTRIAMSFRGDNVYKNIWFLVNSRCSISFG